MDTSAFKDLPSLPKSPVEKALQDLGLELPPPPKQAANYKVCRLSGNTLYLSGHLPFNTDGATLMTGKIGVGGAPVDHGYTAARQCALNLLSTIKAELGSLEKIQHIVKIVGFVQSMDDFHEQHKVMNGCSD